MYSSSLPKEKKSPRKTGKHTGEAVEDRSSEEEKTQEEKNEPKASSERGESVMTAIFKEMKKLSDLRG